MRGRDYRLLLRRRMPASRWLPVTGLCAAAASAGLLVFLLLLATDQDGFLPIIDHANLAFHEAGHAIFRLFGPTAGLYGGTLGQLAMPAMAAAAFWQRREAPGFALSGVWLCENLLNIARYMGDARAQELPLVGGGLHDWALILSRWGALSSDTTLSAFVKAAGWIGMLACWAWFLRRWLADRRYRSQ
jgi:hypothetical protein